MAPSTSRRCPPTSLFMLPLRISQTKMCLGHCLRGRRAKANERCVGRRLLNTRGGLSVVQCSDAHKRPQAADSQNKSSGQRERGLQVIAAAAGGGCHSIRPERLRNAP